MSGVSSPPFINNKMSHFGLIKLDSFTSNGYLKTNLRLFLALRGKIFDPSPKESLKTTHESVLFVQKKCKIFPIFPI